MKKLLAHPFLRGMVKALDFAGAYDAYAGGQRSARTADDLRTPSFRDDVRHMRGDYNRVGKDMRSALSQREYVG